MAKRGLMLATTLAAAIGLAACGRATDDEINQILGITPTPTPSAEELAEATAAASATAAARESAIASPGAAGAAVAMGDVVSGRRQFTTWCAGCHGPGGSGPALLEAGGPGAQVTASGLLPLIREGDGHGVPPGPFRETEISDDQVLDLAAYIRDEAGAAPESGAAPTAATPVAASAVLGDVVSGRRQFTTWCAGCHGPGGSGPALLEPGGPGSAFDPETLLALVRDGEGHPVPPGPYLSTELSDKQVRDLAAYIQEQADGQ
jgi:mono/diheme cytochrome c family protein